LVVLKAMQEHQLLQKDDAQGKAAGEYRTFVGSRHVIVAVEGGRTRDEPFPAATGGA